MLRSFLLFLVFLTQVSFSQLDNFWLPTNGPRGSIAINDLIEFNGEIYAATGGNSFQGCIYKLENNTWQMFNNGIDLMSRIYNLEIHDNSLYAATHNSGIYKLNNGLWEEFNKGLTDNNLQIATNIRELISHNGVLYLGAGNGVFVLNQDDNWEKLSPPDLFFRVDELSVIDDQLYIGAFIPNSNNSSIFIFDIENDNWESLNPQFLVQNQMINQIIQNDDSVFVFTSNSFFKTSDNQNWEESSQEFQTINASFTLNEKLHVISYSNGIYKYADGNFENVWEMDDFVYVINSALVRNEDILLGRNLRGVVSIDKDFEELVEYNNGINNLGIFDLNYNGEYLFAAEVEADYGFIWRTSDQGENWERLTEGLNRAGYQSLSSSNDTIVSNGANGGTYISTNNGDSWVRKTLLQNGFSDVYFNNGRIFSSQRLNQPIIYSDDLGETFVEIEDLPNSHIVSISGVGNTIYLATRIEGIYKSNDNGDSWEAINEGLFGTSGNYLINSVFTDGKTVLATDRNRIYKLDDETWNIVFDTEYSNNLLDILIEDDFGLCMSSFGMVYTTDEGDSWGNSAYGFYRDYPVKSFSADGNYYYLSTDGLGVWRLSKRATNIFFNDKIEELKVYPNPVMNELNIENSIDFERLEIIDFEGKVIKSIDKGFERIDISNLVTGVYFIRAYKNEKIFGTLIIKK